MKRYSLLVLLLCGLFLHIPSLGAATLEIPIAEVTELSPPDTLQAGRFLIKFSLPEELGGATIDFAQLEINLGIKQAEKRPVSLECCALVKDWDAGTVGWAESWSNPGGDLSDSNKTVFTLHSGGETFCAINITHLLQAWADGEPNYGVMLKAVQDKNLSLSRVDGLSLPTGVKVGVKIWYTSKEGDGRLCGCQVGCGFSLQPHLPLQPQGW